MSSNTINDEEDVLKLLIDDDNDLNDFAEIDTDLEEDLLADLPSQASKETPTSKLSENENGNSSRVSTSKETTDKPSTVSDNPKKVDEQNPQTKQNKSDRFQV